MDKINYIDPAIIDNKTNIGSNITNCSSSIFTSGPSYVSSNFSNKSKVKRLYQHKWSDNINKWVLASKKITESELIKTTKDPVDDINYAMEQIESLDYNIEDIKTKASSLIRNIKKIQDILIFADIYNIVKNEPLQEKIHILQRACKKQIELLKRMEEYQDIFLIDFNALKSELEEDYKKYL